MIRLHPVEKILCRFLEWFITFLFFVMILLVVLLVVLRYVFGTTIIGGDEATQFIFVYTTALGAAVSISKGEHIKISFFVDRLPPAGHRLCSVFVQGMIILLHVYLFFLSIRWIGSVGYFESPVLQIPQGIVQVCIPVSCICVILFCLIHVFSGLFRSGAHSMRSEK